MYPFGSLNPFRFPLAHAWLVAELASRRYCDPRDSSISDADMHDAVAIRCEIDTITCDLQHPRAVELVGPLAKWSPDEVSDRAIDLAGRMGVLV